MGQTIRTGNPPIDITLRRSPRARRMTLRVSRLDGRVTLSAPPSVSLRELSAFADERASWIRRALGEVAPPVAVATGTTLPFDGGSLTIFEDPATRRSRQAGDRLLVTPGRAAASAAAHLKRIARERLTAASQAHAATLDRRFSAITLRDTRSRWGSCTADGRLMYSWRLIMAPPEVLDYVAAHEVAHLVHLDHSRAFWRTVARLCPDHAMHRDWLRAHGPALHRYCFQD